MTNIVLVGSKPLDKDYSQVIDKHHMVIRFNFGIPSGKNGKKTTGIALNRHVVIYYKKSQSVFIQKYQDNTDIDYLRKVYSFLQKNTMKVMKISIQDKKRINKILAKLSIKGRLNKEGRVGFGSLIFFLNELWINKKDIGIIKKQTPINIIGFQIVDKQINSFYRKPNSKLNTIGHNANDEHSIIRELIKRGYVCNLEQ